MLAAKNINKDFQFTEIEFFTCKPSKILPDGNDSKAVVGGPYRLKFTTHPRHSNINLYLSLKDISSIFGKNGYSVYIHPHAGPRNFTTDYKDLLNTTAHACLGESSSYLYKAVKANNLSSIIVNIFTWLNSANSTDTWGRNYKYFPNYSSLIFNDANTKDSAPALDLKETITTAIVSEETSPEVSLNEINIETPVSSSGLTVEEPQSPEPVSEPITSIEPEALFQSIRAETTLPVTTYTPYVRT